MKMYLITNGDFTLTRNIMQTMKSYSQDIGTNINIEILFIKEQAEKKGLNYFQVIKEGAYGLFSEYKRPDELNKKIATMDQNGSIVLLDINIKKEIFNHFKKLLKSYNIPYTSYIRKDNIEGFKEDSPEIINGGNLTEDNFEKSTANKVLQLKQREIKKANNHDNN